MRLPGLVLAIGSLAISQATSADPPDTPGETVFTYEIAGDVLPWTDKAFDAH